MHQNIIWIYLILLGLIEVIDLLFFLVNRAVYNITFFSYTPIIQMGYDVIQIFLTWFLGYLAIKLSKNPTPGNYGYINVIRYMDLGITFCIFALMTFSNYVCWKAHFKITVVNFGIIAAIGWIGYCIVRLILQ